MDDKYRVLLYFFVGVVFGFLISYRISGMKKAALSTNIVSDTIIETRIDTIVLYQPKCEYSRVVDTIYLDRNTPVEIIQNHYSKNGVYDAWVSGYNAKLDSIKTYGLTQKEYITTTAVNTMYDNSYSFYPYVGIRSFNGRVRPTIGLMIKSPKKWIIGGEFGLSSNNDVYYGVNIGYKITK